LPAVRAPGDNSNQRLVQKSPQVAISIGISQWERKAANSIYKHL
jgi:hypothetical protein